MKKQKRTSQEKGITLVALIITIIVLLILAVVAIREVQGDGIISKAKKARGDYENAQVKEQGILDQYLAKIEGEVGNNSIGGNNSTGGNSSTGGNDNIDHSEAKIGTIEKKGVFANNQYIAEVREGNVPIPKGFTYVKGDKTGGVVITDGTSEFVWVPTTTDIVAYGLNTSDHREPDVVTNVTPSATVDSASGESYDAVSANLTRAGCTADLNNDSVVNAYDFKIQLTNEFNEMATSVNKYDGFYVGRYEMSMNGTTAQSKSGETSLNNSSSENDWYGLYAKAKTYTNSANSVVSRMIYGSQYNAMMTWIGAAANTNIGDNRNKTRITGTCPTDKINNIYDLYGNNFEWTQEAIYGLIRISRGGSYSDSYSPISRDSYRNGDPTCTGFYGGYGSRLTLYIK